MGKDKGSEGPPKAGTRRDKVREVAQMAKKGAAVTGKIAYKGASEISEAAEFAGAHKDENAAFVAAKYAARKVGQAVDALRKKIQKAIAAEIKKRTAVLRAKIRKLIIRGLIYLSPLILVLMLFMYFYSSAVSIKEAVIDWATETFGLDAAKEFLADWELWSDDPENIVKVYGNTSVENKVGDYVGFKATSNNYSMATEDIHSIIWAVTDYIRVREPDEDIMKATYTFQLTSEHTYEELHHSTTISYATTEHMKLSDSTGHSIYDMRWQPVMAACNMYAITQADNWSALKKDGVDTGESGWKNRYVVPKDIEKICDVFNFEFGYYVDVMSLALSRKYENKWGLATGGYAYCSAPCTKWDYATTSNGSYYEYEYVCNLHTEERPKVDEEGNPIYQTDEDGNTLCGDDGEPVPETETVQVEQTHIARTPFPSQQIFKNHFIQAEYTYTADGDRKYLDGVDLTYDGKRFVTSLCDAMELPIEKWDGSAFLEVLKQLPATGSGNEEHSLMYTYTKLCNLYESYKRGEGNGQEVVHKDLNYIVKYRNNNTGDVVQADMKIYVSGEIGGDDAPKNNDMITGWEGEIPTSDDALVTKVLEYAYKGIGCQYDQSLRMKGYSEGDIPGSSSNVYDCSSFVWRAYKYAGLAMYWNDWAPTSRMERAFLMENNCLVSTNWDDRNTLFQPGDLIFWRSSETGNICHVAIYVGDGKIIHASGTKSGVKIGNIYKDSGTNRFDSCMRPSGLLPSNTGSG